MDSDHTDAAKTLCRLANGDTSAADDLYPAVYQELRCIAARWFRRGDRENTLQPTALVHEAFIHLIDQSNHNYHNRTHFNAVAALAMRQILVQHVRKRKALKRGGDWQRLSLSQAADPDHSGAVVDLLDLDDALNQLRTLHERQAQVVELRFFGDMNTEDIAAILGVSPRTVGLDWRMARSWLLSVLEQGDLN